MTSEQHLYYTRDHEWLKKKSSNEFLLGITDHAQEALGELVFIELPSIGKDIVKGDACVVVESVKAASDVYSPISGKVTEINNLLEQSPEIVNSDPESKGWLCVISSEQPELDGLMNENEYQQFLATTD